MDVEQLAQVEVTFEDPAAPIETVFHFGPRTGVAGRRARHAADSAHLRSASALGAHATERTQEFTLRYRELGGSAVKEIVRQQWNFSPAGSTSETEDYQVDLHRVSMLELWLEPDQSQGVAFAGLAEWRLA